MHNKTTRAIGDKSAHHPSCISSTNQTLTIPKREDGWSVETEGGSNDAISMAAVQRERVGMNVPRGRQKRAE